MVYQSIISTTFQDLWWWDCNQQYIISWIKKKITWQVFWFYQFFYSLPTCKILCQQRNLPLSQLTGRWLQNHTTLFHHVSSLKYLMALHLWSTSTKMVLKLLTVCIKGSILEKGNVCNNLGIQKLRQLIGGNILNTCKPYWYTFDSFNEHEVPWV